MVNMATSVSKMTTLVSGISRTKITPARDDGRQQDFAGVKPQRAGGVEKFIEMMHEMEAP